MSNQSRTANIDYTVVDRSPLELSAGDVVTLGRKDKSWSGWIWATTADGRASFVPEEHLEKLGKKEARVVRPFNARDLSVKKGESVAILREVKGWLWCRRPNGEEGWLPEFVLS